MNDQGDDCEYEKKVNQEAGDVEHQEAAEPEDK